MRKTTNNIPINIREIRKQICLNKNQQIWALIENQKVKVDYYDKYYINEKKICNAKKSSLLKLNYQRRLLIFVYEEYFPYLIYNPQIFWPAAFQSSE